MPWELIMGPAAIALIIGIINGLKARDKVGQQKR